MGMIGSMLEAASYFDWISPIMAFAQDLANGPSYTFLIDGTGGYSPHQVGKMLKAQGIGWWGMMIVNSTLLLTVRKPDAAQASLLLESWGVELQNPAPISTRPAAAAHPARGRTRRRRASQQGLLDRLDRWAGM